MLNKTYLVSETSKVLIYQVFMFIGRQKTLKSLFQGPGVRKNFSVIESYFTDIV